MVGMHVRDEDGADGFGRHTERSKRGWQAPGGGSAHTGIAGIDQHQSVAIVHEPDREAEAMHAGRRAREAGREGGLDFGYRRAGENVKRHVDEAVRYGRHLHCADLAGGDGGKDGSLPGGVSNHRRRCRRESRRGAESEGQGTTGDAGHLIVLHSGSLS
jgi:hypothetical protein